jgi:hypothetical protein
MAYRRPRVDTTASEAFTGLIGLVAQLIDKDLDRKEKSKTEKIVMLGELHRAAERKLAKTKENYTTSSTEYKTLLGDVSPVDTTDTVEIQENLLDWYQLDTKGINQNIAAYETEIKNQLTEIANIQRLQKGLGSTAVVTYEKGDPEIYDMADFEAGRLADTFNIPKETIAKWMKTQPEQIPTKIAELNKARLDALEKLEEKTKKSDKGQKQLDKDKIKNQLIQASRKISNAPVLDKIMMITGSGESESKIADALANIHIEGGTYRDIKTGEIKQTSMSLVEMLAPELRIYKGDKKNVKKEKKNKMSELMFSLNKTLTSFSDTNEGNDDIMGIGRIMYRLQKTYNTFNPINQKVFADIAMRAFNIDLTNPEEFGFLGYDVKPQGQQKQTGKKPPPMSEKDKKQIAFQRIVQGTYEANKEAGIVKNWNQFMKMNWEIDKSDSLRKLWKEITGMEYNLYADAMEEIRQEYK